MKIIETEELKQIQLSILKSIAEFCEANDLRYFLGYGTLIGAVRHKGFIPWDDDIDLIMPRPDYEVFCRQYNASHDNYKVLYSKNDKSCIINFAKVHDIRTRFQEGYSVENNYGVFVDIFPLDGYVDGRQRDKCYRLFQKIHYKSLAYSPHNSCIKNILIEGLKMLLSFESMRTLLSKLEQESMRAGFDESDFVYFFSERVDPFQRTWFSDFIMWPFEDAQYRIPIGYHDFLTKQYGDYMQLPPEEDRVNKHQAKAWWK